MGRNRQTSTPPDGALSIDDGVRAIVSRTSQIAATRDELSLASDLYLDADGRAELLMAVSLAYRVDFSEDEAAVIETVEDLIGLVRWKTRSIGLTEDAGKPGRPAAGKRTGSPRGTRRASGRG